MRRLGFVCIESGDRRTTINNRVRRLRGVIAAPVTTPWITYRILAITWVPNLGDTIPYAWMVATVGVFVIGVTAPAMAFILPKGEI